MIDVQPELYTIARNALLEKVPTAETSSTYTLKPSHFPFASIEESDNSVYRRTSDSADIENHAEIMIEINTYAVGDDKMRVCRDMMGAIDEAYGKIGLQRIAMLPVINYSDTSVYRLTARYRGIISKNKEIYRR